MHHLFTSLGSGTGFSTVDAGAFGASYLPGFSPDSDGICKFLTKTRWLRTSSVSDTDTNPELCLTSPQFGFLSNLVKVFPSLATRPLYLTGESYAGTYIVRTASTFQK